MIVILLQSSSIAATACFTCWLQIPQISYWIETNIYQPIGLQITMLWSTSIAATACFTCRLQTSQISYWIETNIYQPIGLRVTLLWSSSIAATAYFTCRLQTSQISYWIRTNIYQPTGITGDLAAVVFQCCYHLLHMPVADLTDLLLDRNKYLSTNRNYWWSCCSLLQLLLPRASHASCRSNRSPIG